jgi:hypothetical protein
MDFSEDHLIVQLLQFFQKVCDQSQGLFSLLILKQKTTEFDLEVLAKEDSLLRPRPLDILPGDDDLSLGGAGVLVEGRLRVEIDQGLD